LASSDDGVTSRRGSQWQLVDVCISVIYLCYATVGFVIRTSFSFKKQGL